MTTFEIAQLELSQIDVPLVLAMRKHGESLEVVGAPEITPLAQAAGAKGKADEVLRLPAPAGWAAPYLVLTAVSKEDVPNGREALRRAAGAATRAITDPKVALAFPANSACKLKALAEGAALGAYRFNKYLSEPKPGPEHLILVPLNVGCGCGCGGHQAAQPAAGGCGCSTSSDSAPSSQLPVTNNETAESSAPTLDAAQLEALSALIDSTVLVRDLVNTSPAELYPEVFADLAQEKANPLGIETKVWDFEALQAEGFGGIVGVGKGSARKPRLVRLDWNPAGAAHHVALVGKGITFDSGGYSLKPSTAMTTMKMDMAGAATVLATILAAARQNLPVHVTAWLCLAENMVSGEAGRVDDVLRMKSGKTVEVTNTDAEGRLVMADGLAAATAEQPDLVIDIATLTGAAMVALGPRIAGVMGSAAPTVVNAATKVGEDMWVAPLPEHLRSYLDSTVADMCNSSSKRFGGMLTAGLFLREFVGDTPWAHIDIAGPAFNEDAPWGYTGKEGTGFGVRTLVKLLQQIAANK